MKNQLLFAAAIAALGFTSCSTESTEAEAQTNAPTETAAPDAPAAPKAKQVSFVVTGMT